MKKTHIQARLICFFIGEDIYNKLIILCEEKNLFANLRIIFNYKFMINFVVCFFEINLKRRIIRNLRNLLILFYFYDKFDSYISFRSQIDKNFNKWRFFF